MLSIFFKKFTSVITPKISFKSRTTALKFPSWVSSSEPNLYPWGWGFDPSPPSVSHGSGVARSCGVGYRHGSDPALLWLWCSPVAAALIQLLVWELPYAMGVDLKDREKKKFYFQKFKITSFFLKAFFFNLKNEYISTLVVMVCLFFHFVLFFGRFIFKGQVSFHFSIFGTVGQVSYNARFCPWLN